jgi:hypothetical protein
VEYYQPDHKSGAVQENGGDFVVLIIDEGADKSKDVHVDDDAVERKLLA